MGAILRARTRMSSRGQVVIPKALREAAGLTEGDELDVIFDGERLLLALVREVGGETGEAPSAGLAVREQVPGYRSEAAAPGAGRPSKVWAERVRALSDLEGLRSEFEGVRFRELWSEARREAEIRAEPTLERKDQDGRGEGGDG